ncbi:immunity 22 family protein [Aquisphaera insulae]|uniref:immunity 22 family protein n=1 Tax=Aquisphaera insulae TaxID=2712864 RepID=UPI0013EAA896|nr:immunity 22 family protein [Aquisphaera insulae]
MAAEFEIVDVWLCRFSSDEEADAYFEETYDEDDEDRPISQFAADMGERFYDHDFVERGEFLDPPGDDIAAALGRHSFSSSYLADVVQQSRSASIAPFNLVLLVWNAEISNPKSVTLPGRELQYLGRFRCDPGAEPAG